MVHLRKVSDKCKYYVIKKKIIFIYQKIGRIAENETVHFVKSVKLVLVYVKLLKPLGVFVISKPVSVSETFVSNGFNSFTYTETSFTDFTKWTVSIFNNSINFLKNENKMFFIT